MADWVFQWRETLFPLATELRKSREIAWRAPRYRDRIAVGDRVWMARVGPEPGLYYVATVVSPVYEEQGEAGGRWHTDLRFDYRIDPPMSRSALVADPLLSSLRALRGFQGTNEPIEEPQARRLQELCEPWFWPLDDPSLPVRPRLDDVGRALDRHVAEIRLQLRKSILALDPDQFEQLVVRLLNKLGFDAVPVGRTGDSGIDVDASISIHGLAEVRTKVQAKRWAGTVGAPTVRDLRGALRVDERGLLITTSDFSSEARKEAEAAGKARITLINGEELASRCLELQLGVSSRLVTLYALAPDRLLQDSDPYEAQAELGVQADLLQVNQMRT